ncbi:arylsulfatase B-like [Sitophilus oryzae]|uniref:Arylsulfatase B-like n=1 Tax=Sitophilus oryzae TaxID=7048 RepID=A0A6J2X8A7_SITOR|nr:arylsulfatase B-like [Sitophilus oryzae]
MSRFQLLFNMKSLIVLVVIVSIVTCKKQSKPNIVVILGDDIGWNDFSFHGSNQIPTPNIDALGYNGVFLNRFYTQPTCSPSRAALLTGKYPMRMGYQGTPLNSGEDRPLPDDVETLPQKLKELGYKTHLVGKWHLSAGRRKDTPTGRGFDTHFGYWNGYIGYFDFFAYQPMDPNDTSTGETEWSGLDLHDGFAPQWEYQNQYATDLFTEKSLEVIDKHNSSDPLFLMIGHLAAHTGAHGTELGVPDVNQTQKDYWYIDDPVRQRFADVVNRLDKSVGDVVQQLQKKDMLKNSIILFLSDNGAQTVGIYENHGSNYPLKGLKFSLLEGGVRGSAVLFSPLLSKKGYINNHLLHISDVYTTLIELAGGTAPNNTDGINQWSTISYDKNTQRKEILLNVDEIQGYSGIISKLGRYKFLNGSYLLGIYDGALGETGRNSSTPTYDASKVISSAVNQAIQSLSGISPLNSSTISTLREQLDISSCNQKTRTSDSPCLGECLFDLWKDPCETENIVSSSPTIAEKLREKLYNYVSQIVPERNRGVDLNSNPKKYNNTWCTWLDDSECYKTLL